MVLTQFATALSPMRVEQMPSQLPLISVIIPHLNQAESLDACLSSLDAQTFERSQFEVLVVDNGSYLPPDPIVARHPGAVLLRELQRGPGPARNYGVERARGNILAFIDADCRADPNWLTVIAQTFAASSEGTILGGDVRIWREDKKGYTAIEAYECVFAYRFQLYIERHGFCGTGNLALRRSDFARIGPFAGIGVAEDMEWGERARAAGFMFRYIR